MLRTLSIALAALVMAGCTTSNSLYYWGNYEQALYDFTKRPGELDAYIVSLQGIIETGEERNQVPPGLYAEYAYALQLAGRQDEAAAYFEKERAAWPESEKLMTLMLTGPEGDLVNDAESNDE